MPLLPGFRSNGAHLVERQLATIDQFERDGVLPEGGATWEAFTARVEEAAATMTASLSRRSSVYTADEAAAFIVEAAIITTLWLAAQAE